MSDLRRDIANARQRLEEPTEGSPGKVILPAKIPTKLRDREVVIHEKPTRSQDDYENTVPTATARHRGLEPPVESEVDTIRKRYQGEDVRIDPMLGVLFNSKPQHVDKLSLIDSVDAQAEKQLQGLGIYQFRQIADLSDDQIVALTRRDPTFKSTDWYTWRSRLKISGGRWPSDRPAPSPSSEETFAAETPS